MPVTDESGITSLLIRYWGIGRPLQSEEKEILLAALQRLKDKGIK